MAGKIGSRLSEVIAASGMTNREVAKRASIDESYIYDLLANKTSPTLAKLTGLAKALRTSVSVLTGDDEVGEPEIYDSPENRTLIDKIEAARSDLKDGIRERFAWFAEKLQPAATAAPIRDAKPRILFSDEEEPRQMSDEEVEALTKTFSNLLEFRRGRRWKAREVPLVGSVSAGKGIEIQENYEKLRQIPDVYWDAGARAAVKALGVSMWDMGITPNDLLYFSPANTAQNEQIILFTLNGEAYVKEFEFRDKRIRLLSAHPDYEPMDVKETDDFRIFGVVVGRSGFPPKRRDVLKYSEQLRRQQSETLKIEEKPEGVS